MAPPFKPTGAPIANPAVQKAYVRAQTQKALAAGSAARDAALLTPRVDATGAPAGNFKRYAPPLANPWTKAAPVKTLTAGIKAAAPLVKAAPAKQGTNITSMQKFLAAKGYNIAVDGQNGPLTQAAAADFRGSRNPHAFNIGHGVVHDTAAPVAPAATDTSSTGPVKLPAAPVKHTPVRSPASSTAPVSAPQTTDLQQAQQTVSALLDPVIQQIRAAEEARATSGQQAISGYTSAQQKLLGTYSPLAAAEYGGAEQGQNAIDQALAQRLQGQGSDLSAGLGQKLQAISADPQTAARILGTAGSTAIGAANTGYALGSASMGALNQQGAAAQDYARAQPGIAGLAGIQSSKALQGQVNTDLHTQLSAIEAKAPGLIQTVLGQISGAHAAERKLQVASLIAAGKTDQALKIANQNNQTKVSIANANNATKLQVADAKALAAGNKKTGQLSDSQLSKFVDAWHTGKTSNIRVPVLDSKGQPVTNANGVPQYVSKSIIGGNLNYGQAYSRLRAFGVPDQKARQVLNTAYARGDSGRAWVTNAEQSVLSKAGLPSKAKVINGQGVLTGKQYKALLAAGIRPPGQATSDGYFVIAPGN